MHNPDLSDEQKDVLFNKATERPFSGEFLYDQQPGNYHCANCRAQLFDSSTKYDSGCGWPSFDQAIKGTVNYLTDSSHGMERTEVTCANCGGHLGHVFSRRSNSNNWTTVLHKLTCYQLHTSQK